MTPTPTKESKQDAPPPKKLASGVAGTSRCQHQPLGCGLWEKTPAVYRFEERPASRLIGPGPEPLALECTQQRDETTSLCVNARLPSRETLRHDAAEVRYRHPDLIECT